MKSYQSIYPKLRHVMASLGTNPDDISADTRLNDLNIEFDVAKRRQLAEKLNSAFNDANVKLSETEVSEDSSIRELAMRVHTSSAVYSDFELRVAIYNSIKRSEGIPATASFPPTFPVSNIANIPRLKRNLVREIGGFTLGDLNDKWQASPPAIIGDIITLVLALR